MPVVLAAIFYTQTWPLMILGGLVVFVAGVELSKLLATQPLPFLSLLVFGLYCAAVAEIGIGVSWEAVAALPVATGVGVVVLAARKSNLGWIDREIGSLWIAAPVASILVLHASTNFAAPFAPNPVLLLLLPLWAADIAAIFVGMALGRHLLAPNISPKKTVEGGIGNLLAAVGVAIPLSTWLGYDWTIGLWCGLAIGILGQAGDLFESWLKRRAGVKDSGTILPGHGGVLDRIDSLLFSAPAVCLILVNAPRTGVGTL